MINHSPIYLTEEDHTKLRLLLASTSRAAGVPAHALADELHRAIIVDAAIIPRDVVTLDSRVEYEDVDSGEIAEYEITLPERANVDEHRISVLAPIGTALIGFRAGEIVHWKTPGGICRLRILRVTAAEPAGARPQIAATTSTP
jgi:regulator of nucleoside diphosphate kinase